MMQWSCCGGHEWTGRAWRQGAFAPKAGSLFELGEGDGLEAQIAALMAAQGAGGADAAMLAALAACAAHLSHPSSQPASDTETSPRACALARALLCGTTALSGPKTLYLSCLPMRRQSPGYRKLTLASLVRLMHAPCCLTASTPGHVMLEPDVPASGRHRYGSQSCERACTKR